MPVIMMSISKRSLDFINQRKAYLLRTVKHESWEAIALQVVNVQGEHPSWVTVRDAVTKFNVKKGYRQLRYHKCGRKPWKLTPAIKSYILRRLLSLRRTELVTSVTLQADVAKRKGMLLSDVTIRKFLSKTGYKWLPRSQKRKYSGPQQEKRLAFARAVLRLSTAKLREKLCMALDGVVLSMPPEKAVERFNYCVGAESNMWRKPGEANLTNLAGANEYKKQVPLSRAIPLWGGVSAGGFAPVLWHRTHKTNVEEWSSAVRQGKLTNAIRSLNPVKRDGPYTVLCDGEKFLTARQSMVAYRAKKVTLWVCPAKSPDLNPVEMFWGWLRQRLLRMDLLDLKKKRKPLCKDAYTLRIKTVLKSTKAQQVASRCAKKLRGSCQQVVTMLGAAADN